jgi:Endonuclease NucS
MADEVRVWEVDNAGGLREVGHKKLDLEERIQQWIERDISVLDPELIVIGKEVETAFGKFIDLLCMNVRGDLVIVELKRAKTSRDVTAQALDYASWVKDLVADEIQNIAAKYFKERDKSLTLDSAFRAKFDTELPEVLNEHHAMRIVASEIDDGTERIIRYLSETFSEDINAIRFQFFQNADGRQLLARTFTVAPEEAETNVKKRPGKRAPPATPEEMEKAASDAGVGNLYHRFVQTLEPYFRAGTTKTSLYFEAKWPDGSRKVIGSLVPGLSSPEKGLRYTLYSKRLAELIDVAEDQVVAHLPPNAQSWEFYASAPLEYKGWAGYIKNEDDVQKFAGLLKHANKSLATG